MIEGSKKLQHSNPSIFSILPLYASLQIFDKISMQEMFEKTRKLVYYIRILIALECPENNEKILIVTPCVDSGAQLSFAFKHLKQEFPLADIVDSFMEAGIYVDKRQPNIIRMAPTALYNTFLDCHKFVAVLKYVLTKV